MSGLQNYRQSEYTIVVVGGEKNMAELASMMNIGREMAKKLDSVGIGSAEELIRSGGTGLPEIKGKVSECLSGAFVCFGRSGLQCGVQQPS